MKKWIAVFFTALLAFSVTACGNSGKETGTTEIVMHESEEKTTAVPEVTTTEETEEDVETVTYYYGDENAEYLLSEEVEVKEITPQGLMDLLAEKGVLSEKVVINKFMHEGDGSLIMDVSESFATQLRSMGTAGEYLMLGSVVNTFLDNLDGESILITVNGETLESGHEIYDRELTFYK